jgi:2'-5' RNA ligase
MKGLGCFPDAKRPHVLWVGLEAHPLLIHLQQQIEVKLNDIGLDPEKRDFSPHLTLARFKFPKLKEVDKFLEQNKYFKTESWSVKEFHLYSSQLTPEGAVHKIEESYDLRF